MLSGLCPDVENNKGGEPREARSNPSNERRPNYVSPEQPLQARAWAKRKLSKVVTFFIPHDEQQV